MKTHFVHRHPAALGIAAAALLAAATASAGTASIRIGPAGSENDIAVFSLDPDRADRSGVTVRNFSEEFGSLSVRPFTDPSLHALPTVDSLFTGQSFVMLDTTLLDVRVAGIPTGRRARAVQIRMGYADARLRRKGIRAGSLRVMRLDEVRRRWFPAIRTLGRRADIRFLRGKRADLRVGHYGIDFARRNAWVVIDSNSVYGLAGLVIPEPAAAGFIGLGCLIMVFQRGRKLARS